MIGPVRPRSLQYVVDDGARHAWCWSGAQCRAWVTALRAVMGVKAHKEKARGWCYLWSSGHGLGSVHRRRARRERHGGGT